MTQWMDQSDQWTFEVVDGQNRNVFSSQQGKLRLYGLMDIVSDGQTGG